jgi:uncharacterized protein (TIGR02231 family)
VVLGGLSHSIDPSSIQVSGKGSFIILGVKHQKNYLQEQEMPRNLRVLTDSLTWYSNQLIFKRNGKEVLNKEEALLLANQSIGGEEGLTAAQLKEMADFFRNRMNEISLEKIDVDEEIKVLNKRITAIKQQINEKRAGWVRNTGEIIVSISSKSPTKAVLDVSYVVNNAGWNPTYDIRANDTDSPIELNYKASVYQNTGVAWKDINLTLSTSNPALGGQKPYLSTWYLNIYQPIVGAVTRGAARTQDKASMAFENDGWGGEEEVEYLEAPEPEFVADYTQTVQTSLNTQFEIALKYSVPSGGKPELVDIQNHELKADYEYSAAPKLDRDAFLLASITGWEELSLLPGEASVYFEGTFISNSYIDPNNTQDTLKLSLGRDKRIVIDRERVKDYTSKKIIGGKKKELFIFEIEVRNTKSEKVSITLEDQVPISQNKEITVDLISRGGAKYEESTGKLTWVLYLEPKETRKLSFEFEVLYPKDKVISGL